MRLSILGGTGDIGAGLALRWAKDTEHEILVGSRDPARAREKANEYAETLASRGFVATIKGFENGMAADRGDVVVLAIPPYHIRDTLEAVRDRLGDAIVVTPAVGLKRNDVGARYHPPDVGSVTAFVQQLVPDGTPVVGTYHNLPAARLADLDAELDLDTPIVADDEDAKATVVALTDAIEGLRPIDTGPIANAAEVESVTALLLSIVMNNDDMHDIGVRFV